VSALSGQLSGGDRAAGGIEGYPLESLFEEVAFLGYYLHWPSDQVMSFDHRERQQWVREVSRINQRLNNAAKGE
jgi:hypothetical protein